ncbi:MAG TPA: cysteine methyltransferase [Dysgonomonas sp.]|nr:cysteine methyltransferase [Dysgonomonas sp.]
MNLYRTFIDSPVGKMAAYATDKGLCILAFDNQRGEEHLPINIEDCRLREEENEHLTLAKKELSEYFSGTRKEFTVQLDISGTDFQKQVWSELLTIPYGETRSYMQQTIALGDSKKIRAVANANGKNKIAIIIPCHRVIGSDGSLTGFAGGLERKRWLLNLESQQKTLFD